MEHLDNDMDDLFQKAGELYPLKTTESDWDAVAGKLRDESFSDLNAVPGLTSSRSRTKRRWLLLLLFISLGLGIAYTSGLLNHKNGGSVSERTSGVVETKSLLSKPAIENKSAANDQEKSSKATSQSQAAVPGNLSEANPADENYRSSTVKKRTFNLTNDKRLLTRNNRNEKNPIVAAGTFSKSDLSTTNENSLSNDPQTPDTNKTSNAEPITGAASDPLNSAGLVVPAVAAKENQKGTADKKTDSSILSKAPPADSSSSKKKSADHASHSKGFYVGLLVGPDVSTVKFQSVKQLGYSAGFLVGFRFNKRLALETGLLFDKKFYYSNGEYFKLTNGYYSSNVAVDGNCNMLEIPLTLRFDFATIKNHGFFVKAGVSSYVMTHQYYATTKNGVPGYNWPINYSMSYFPSVVQISGGYEYSIDKKTKIQIEPYLKIPLRGLGEGDLPISSFGIYFGITRSFR